MPPTDFPRGLARRSSRRQSRRSTSDDDSQVDRPPGSPHSRLETHSQRETCGAAAPPVRAPAPAWTSTGVGAARARVLRDRHRRRPGYQKTTRDREAAAATKPWKSGIRPSSRLRGVRGARHTRVVQIDEQPAAAGLDPRLAVPLHQRAHPSVLVDEYLVGITVDHEDVAVLKDAAGDLLGQFLARRIVLPQIGNERAHRLLALDPESRTGCGEYHVVSKVCQPCIDIAPGGRLRSLPRDVRDLLGRISLSPYHRYSSQQQDQGEKPAQHSHDVLLHPDGKNDRMGTSVRMGDGSLADPEGYFSYESIAIHWRGLTSG